MGVMALRNYTGEPDSFGRTEVEYTREPSFVPPSLEPYPLRRRTIREKFITHWQLLDFTKFKHRTPVVAICNFIV